GYTVSDVVMYWKETPVRGVENAELPQFSILGHETNDRKVRKYINGPVRYLFR
ncbi:jg4067, partial [Pararge aegeria aegeria]